MAKNKLVTEPDTSGRLAEAVENLSQRLQVFDDTVSDILHELQWLLQNHINVRVINRMPAEPASSEWSAKLARLNPNAQADSSNENLIQGEGVGIASADGVSGAS